MPHNTDDNNENTDMKFGYVALVGAPNAGKSTLMNQILGTKLSIVSRKAQTTRTRIAGIYTEEHTQIVFIDTPGLFQPKKQFERAMISSIWSGFDDADLILLLVDAQKTKIDSSTIELLEALKTHKKKAYLVFNKVDLVKKAALLARITQYKDLYEFDNIFMISALINDGVAGLAKTLRADMPNDQWHYDEDQLTDAPGKLLAAEITREKIFDIIHDEIPYTSTVETDSYEDREDGALVIEQTIYVQRDGHKGIMLGKRGVTIKEIGMRARVDLEEMLDRRVRLNLFIKVRRNWQEKKDHYEALGLEFLQ